MSLPVSFCTNSVALPLAYQVNGGNKFIIVFLWCLYLSLHPYIQAITKMPLHVKKNTGVTLSVMLVTKVLRSLTPVLEVRESINLL